MAYLIGTDPELFVTKGGKLQSAFGLIKGDKKNPFKVDKGAVQVDGMALEFNTDPTDNEDEFVNNIATVMSQLKDMVPEYEFFVEPTAQFGADYIKAQPSEAKEMGCDPDYNAYTGEVNEKPDEDSPFRTASGHIHIGWTENEPEGCPFHFDECCEVAKQLDIYLGIPSLMFDNDNERRKMYGQAGSFRPKPYGMEYRVLSNAWLKHPELQRWVFQQAQKAVEDLVEGKRAQDRIDSDIVRALLRKNSCYSAKNHIEHYDFISMPPIVNKEEEKEEKKQTGGGFIEPDAYVQELWKEPARIIPEPGLVEVRGVFFE